MDVAAVARNSRQRHYSDFNSNAGLAGNDSWSGDCVNGQVVMSANKTCTANFTTTRVADPSTGGHYYFRLDHQYHWVTTINSCGTYCIQTYLSVIAVTLIPTPATDWQFGSWSGDCVNGQVVMSVNKHASANFTQQPVVTPGNGAL
ncbi:MAG: hypothetical protein R3E08_11795 [Thiotrichaceae bacterium]